MRADIQALRALAVGIVVLYHFWPERLAGGYVGVDVFFVISGFLITSHLIDRPPRSASDLVSFWARRVRRLLPASFLVLIVTLGASLLWAPSTVWSNIAKQVAASALYLQNWFLAAESVDYLAEDTAPTPVQHFWSLSVEEQFYIVWPLLMAVALIVATRRRWSDQRLVLTGVVGVVVVLSFCASVLLTSADPSAAYFVSWTRFWELGMGGLAAGLFPACRRLLDASPRARSALAAIGLAMIFVAAVTYRSTTPFPGVAALLPVVGTSAIIVAAIDEQRSVATRWIGWRPIQVLGDISYSLYLWHWPAVVLVPLALGSELYWWQEALCILALIAVSYLTKIFVEDRFRGSSAMGRGTRGTFAFMLAGMIAVSGASYAVVASVTRAEHDVASSVSRALATDECVGANALASGSDCKPHGNRLITPPEFAVADQPDPYRDGCWVLGDFADQRSCHYGSDSEEALKVALVGNSHAGHWLPALQQIDESTPWSITTYLISECYTVDIPIDFGDERTKNCSTWNDRVRTEIAEGDYDLVVISNRTSRPLEGIAPSEQADIARAAYTRVLSSWADRGIPVLVLKDTPYATELSSVPDCVAEHSDDLAACDGSREREQSDPQYEAASAMNDPHISTLDVTDRFCAESTCYSVLGGVIVYFDRGHMSGTFARSLAPAVERAADELIARFR